MVAAVGSPRPRRSGPRVPFPGSVRAAHTLILANNTLAPEDTEKPLNVYSLFIRVGEVPKLAAERLGYKKEAFELVRSANVQARPNVLVGTLTITASDHDPKRAALIADTFVDSLKTVLADQTTQRRQLQIDSQLKAAEQIQGQINDLNRQIVTSPTRARSPRSWRPASSAGRPSHQPGRHHPEPARSSPALLTLESGSILWAQRPLALPRAAGGGQLQAEAAPCPRPDRPMIGLLVGAGVSFAIDFARSPPLRGPRSRTCWVCRWWPRSHSSPAGPGACPGILAFNRPLSPLAEGYRVLRTALLRMPTRVFTEAPTSTEASVEGEAAQSGVGEWRPVGETNGHTPEGRARLLAVSV